MKRIKPASQSTGLSLAAVQPTVALTTEQVNAMLTERSEQARLQNQAEAALILVNRKLIAAIKSLASRADAIRTQIDSLETGIATIVANLVSDAASRLRAQPPIYTGPNLSVTLSESNNISYHNAKDQSVNLTEDWTYARVSIGATLNYTRPEPEFTTRSYGYRSSNNSIDLAPLTTTISLPTVIVAHRDEIARLKAELEPIAAEQQRLMTERGRMPEHQKTLRENMLIAQASDGDTSNLDAMVESVASLINLPV